MTTKKPKSLKLRQVRTVELDADRLRDWLSREQLADLISDEQLIEYAAKELRDELFFDFVLDQDDDIEVV